MTGCPDHLHEDKIELPRSALKVAKELACMVNFADARDGCEDPDRKITTADIIAGLVFKAGLDNKSSELNTANAKSLTFAGRWGQDQRDYMAARRQGTHCRNCLRPFNSRDAIGEEALSEGE